MLCFLLIDFVLMQDLGKLCFCEIGSQAFFLLYHAFGEKGLLDKIWCLGSTLLPSEQRYRFRNQCPTNFLELFASLLAALRFHRGICRSMVWFFLLVCRTMRLGERSSCLSRTFLFLVCKVVGYLLFSFPLFLVKR